MYDTTEHRLEDLRLEISELKSKAGELTKQADLLSARADDADLIAAGIALCKAVRLEEIVAEMENRLNSQEAAS